MTGSRRYLWLVTVACMAACSEHGPTEPALEQYHGVPSFAISAGSFTLASNSAHSTTGTLSIGAPAVILGDVLIAHIVVRNMNGPTTSTPHVICAPAGWVSIRRTNNKVDNATSDISHETFRFSAAANAAAAPQPFIVKAGSCAAATSSGNDASGAIVLYKGVDPGNPVDQHAGNTGPNSPPFATPDVTTTANGARVLRFVGVEKSPTTVSFTGITTIYSISSPSGDARTAAGGEFLQSSMGPTGGGTFAFGPAGGDDWVGHTIALRAGGTVTVNKVIINDFPPVGGDAGKFNLRVNGVVVKADAAHNGTTGAVSVSAGSIVVSELAGTGTDLADYATTISCNTDKGQSSTTSHTFTIAALENVTCTITNTRKAQLNITKVIEPDGDTGKFDLTVTNASNVVTTVGDDVGETTVTAKLAPGTYTVGEAAGTGTDLDDYAAVISGACAANGQITLASGQTATCTITNTRKAVLTIEKVVVPGTDTGLFNLQVDGNTVAGGADVSGGEDVEVKLTAGTYTVGETAGTNTDLANYTAVISGACAVNGQITLTAGQTATCTITNTRKAVLTIQKVLVPAGDGGVFNLQVGGTTVSGGANVSNGASVDTTLVPGTYTVGETAGTLTDLDDYTAVIGGACATSGQITLTAGQTATCTITNTRITTGGGGGGTTYFLALDNEAIHTGDDGLNTFTAADLNGSIVTVGQRAELAWFAANATATINLPSGQVSDEGWFALKTIPTSWASAGPTGDGLRNLLVAGPGLGGGTDPEALLDGVPDVTPLRATGLAQLVGNKVCAIVWDSDVSVNYGPPLTGSLKGANRGIIAFEVTAVTQFGTGSTLPKVTVTVLDADVVCSGTLTLLSTAPVLTSSSVPQDVNPGT